MSAMKKRIHAHKRRCQAIWLGLVALLLGACQLSDAPLDNASEPQSEPTIVSETSDVSAAQLLERALLAHRRGDYPTSAQLLSDLIRANPSPAELRQARYYLAESYALRERWTSAVESFRVFVEDGEQDSLHQQALFWLARGYEQAGDWASAAATYERYRSFETVLVPYAAMREAAQRRALEQPQAAAELYELAAASDIDRAERAGSYEKAIALRRQLGQADLALEHYRKLLELADLPVYRSRILNEAADLAEQLGQVEQARAWRLEIITIAPQSSYALALIDPLLADPQSGFGPAQAAKMLFNSEAYEAALPHFDSAIAQAPVEEALELRRLRALTIRALGDLAGAMQEQAAIAAEAPGSETARQAELDYVQTLGWSGETAQAIAEYRNYADRYAASEPPEPRAPEALSRVAQLYERDGDAQAAAQQRLVLGLRFPTSDQAISSLFATGWYFYRAGDTASAQQAWTVLADNEAAGIGDRARAAYWTVKLGVAPEAAVARWQQAFSFAPEAYYGTRSADQLSEQNQPLPHEFSSRALGSELTHQDWQVAGEWLALSFSLPVSETVGLLTQTPSSVANEPAILRGLALEAIGLHKESINEWNSLRTRWQDDPLKLTLLARQAHEAGVHSVAIRALFQLEGLVPNSSLLPDPLLRVLYPTPYSDLVRDAARQEGIDPLLLYALMRQESLFDEGAVSSVGALGLGQVMPATGAGIAQQLGMQEFETSMLLHPAVSVRFAAFYISRQIAQMDNNMLAGLSAYNGGPGNAFRWIDEHGLEDMDYFAESIDFYETRAYVKAVYAQYDLYRRLYQE
jgi:soluble lytic murein transglycosylase